ncbi:MAG: ribosomal protein L7/L12 [Limisphaerales bacterium]
MTPTQREAILAELKGGNKIAAIKLCREATGMGLAEAKEWVEKLETSPDAPLSPAPEAGALSPVAEALFAGNKILAIKRYREQVTPVAGLAEAKEAVEQLEAGLRTQHPEKFNFLARKATGTVCALVFGLVLVGIFFWVIFVR